jgi:hypothetical protein
MRRVAGFTPPLTSIVHEKQGNGGGSRIDCSGVYVEQGHQTRVNKHAFE